MIVPCRIMHISVYVAVGHPTGTRGMGFYGGWVYIQHYSDEHLTEIYVFIVIP